MTATDENAPAETSPADTAEAKTAHDKTAQVETPPVETAPAERTQASAPSKDTPPATARDKRHPLAGKYLWLGLASLAALAAGAALAAAPLVAAEPPFGWIAAAFGVVGGLTLLMAFAAPRWGGVMGALVEGVALLVGALVIGFGVLASIAPPAMIVGATLVAFGAGGYLSGFGAIRAKGWSLQLLAGTVALGAGAALVALTPPPTPWTPFLATGAALIVFGLCVTGLAVSARKARVAAA